MQPILFILQSKRGFTNQRGSARGIAPLRPWMGLPKQNALYISGVTRDSAGSPLGSCSVQLYRTINDQVVEEVVSDGSGNYTFSPVGLGQLYYVVAYKQGSPDVAGTTVNTLVGS